MDGWMDGWMKDNPEELLFGHRLIRLPYRYVLIYTPGVGISPRCDVIDPLENYYSTSNKRDYNTVL